MPMKIAEWVFMMISGWSMTCSAMSSWLSSPSGLRMPIQA